jgi:glycosyltransferase involved in cell wall biosynthesis
MHRSGTSAVTRLLHAMGAYVGAEDELLPALECNSEGFWERQDIVDINEALFDSLNSSWDTPQENHNKSLSAKALQEFNTSAAAVIEDLNCHSPWVIKDPRLCLFMDLWKPLLANPFVVVCWRDPLEVARSLKRRDGLPISYGLALWELYTVSALNAAADTAHCVFSYNDLMCNPDASAKKLYEAFGEIAAGKLKLLTQEEIIKIINPSLRHERSDVSESDYLSVSQLKLLNWLKNQKGDPPRVISEGAGVILEEIGQLRASLKAARQCLAAANDGLARSQARTLTAIHSADSLADSADIIFNSFSGKASRAIESIAGYIKTGNVSSPQVFMKNTAEKYREWKKSRDLRVIALLNTYNEEHIIGPFLEHMISQGVDVFLSDNESTDRTLEIASEFLGRGLIGIEIIHRNNFFSLTKMLQRKEELSAELDADWFMHVDCDEFRFPPVGYKTLKEAFVAVDDRGFNAVEFMEYSFVATQEHPEHSSSCFLDTMQWYYPFQPFRPHRINAWKRCTSSIDLHSFGGHQVNFEGRKIYPEYFILKHYTYLSRQAAIKKFVNSVFDPLEKEMHGFRHGLREDDVVLPSEKELHKFVSNAELDASNLRKTRFIAEAWNRRREKK